MDLSTAPRGELVRLVYELRDKVALLEAQVAELRARITDQGPTQKTPPSFVKPNTKTKQKKDRKIRDQGFARKLDVPTDHVVHAFDSCPDCGGKKLGKPVVAYTRQVIDIPAAPVSVTQHIIMKRWCFRCKKQVRPKPNFSSVTVGKQRIGIRLTSIINTLKEVCRQPVATIRQYLSMFHNFHLSHGAIVRILHQTARIGQPLYQKHQETIRGSPHVHADETGGRENGKNGYWWSFNTKTTHYLSYRKTRGKQVVEDVLGNDFQGVLSSDFYAAYNTYAGFHQRCWVHYLRDIHTLTETYPKDRKLLRWAKKIYALYGEATAWSGPNRSLPAGLQQTIRREQQQRYEDKLRTLCMPWLQTETPMSTLAARAMTFLQELFVFLRFPDIPADNNAAERVLRHLVVSRKISGGTRSPRGSNTKAILASLFSTWKLQGKNPMEQCQLLLAGV